MMHEVPEYDSMTNDERRRWSWYLIKGMSTNITALHEDIHGNGKPGLVEEIVRIKQSCSMAKWGVGVGLSVIGVLVALEALFFDFIKAIAG